MKRRLISTFLFVLLAVALFAKPYKITASKLNVRSTPDASGAVVGSLTQNTQVEVNRISGGWAEITFKGKKAYISAQYITPVSDSSTSSNNKNNKSSNTSGSKNGSKNSGNNMPPQNPRKNKQNNANNSSKSGNKNSSNNMPPQNPRKNKQNNTANNSKGSGAKVVVENDIEESMLKGFRATFDMRWAMTNGSFRKNKVGGFKPINMGADKRTISGFTTGFGFEYNALVHQTSSANIMVGGRTGFNYDYFASGSFASGSKEAGNYIKGRCSYHSITFPLQPQLSFEWKAGNTNMGFGFFTGPVFEAYFMRNLWKMETGESTSLCVENYVTGHILGVGANGQTIDPTKRSGSFNCMWDTGIFFQINKFRFFFSTAWGMHNYLWTKGGPGVDSYAAHINRPVAFGFQTVLGGKKKKNK